MPQSAWGLRAALLPAGQEKVKEAPKLLFCCLINNLSESLKPGYFSPAFFSISKSQCNHSELEIAGHSLTASWPSGKGICPSLPVFWYFKKSLLPKEQARINSICNLKRKISLSPQFRQRKKILNSALLTAAGKRTISISLSPLLFYSEVGYAVLQLPWCKAKQHQRLNQ